MLVTRQKSHYTESEAAEELGISISQLRTLVRERLARTEEDIHNLPMAYFQPADLLLLKLITSGVASPTL
ncbi:MAG TPA: MerR family transcriptional regulator [Bryobacteraceae bacterium]|nr:MerR family transcriptional regulator [Bryobacteraceae bacterium]